jgi:hypothetical protein
MTERMIDDKESDELLGSSLVLDLKCELKWLGPEDEQGYLWALQDGGIFGWSESNMRYELVWWLAKDGTPRTDYPNQQHIKNLCRDRPFDPEWLKA